MLVQVRQLAGPNSPGIHDPPKWDANTSSDSGTREVLRLLSVSGIWEIDLGAQYCFMTVTISVQ